MLLGCFLSLASWGSPGTLWAEPGTACRPLEERPIKVEMWIAKRRMPEYSRIRRDLAQMGHTWVSVFPYPGRNPSRVVAVGRCVPAYIARHILKQSLEYYGEIKSLVHTRFVAPHWIGLATSLFAENSLQPITPEQLDQLLDPALSTEEFHALYQSFSTQDKTVHAFGRELPNPKLMK